MEEYRRSPVEMVDLRPSSRDEDLAYIRRLCELAMVQGDAGVRNLALALLRATKWLEAES